MPNSVVFRFSFEKKAESISRYNWEREETIEENCFLFTSSSFNLLAWQESIQEVGKAMYKLLLKHIKSKNSRQCMFTCTVDSFENGSCRSVLPEHCRYTVVVDCGKIERAYLRGYKETVQREYCVWQEDRLFDFDPSNTKHLEAWLQNIADQWIKENIRVEAV